MAIDKTLTAHPWRLTELPVEPVPDGQDAPYLLLTNDGDLMGFGGCNYFTSKYRTETDGKLIVSSLRATHRECSDSAKQERTLLTSLLLANALQVRDEELAFLLNGSCLIKLRPATDLSVEELLQQSKLLKVRKKRASKARSKKKKAVTKSKRHPKTAAPNISGKSRPVATAQSLPH